MESVFIGVGSNIHPEKNVLESLRRLNQRIRLLQISTFYLSKPEDRPWQPDFYNGVVEIGTGIEPSVLKFSILRKIETELDRKRTLDKSAPRTIDLDILVYGERILSMDTLEIPDPDISKRAHLAIPLYELAPELVLPDSDQPLVNVAAGFKGHSMRSLEAYTRFLKEELL